MSTEAMVVMFALMGIVIVISALLSGFIERSNFPQVAAFLALGAALGPWGLGVLNISLDSEILRVVATLSLALVLFTDALTIDAQELRRHSALASLILGPGTLAAALLIGVAAVAILGLPPAAAAVLSAALASTDPVLLRGLLRRPDLPGQVRHALRLESSLNDVVLLPVIMIGAAYLAGPGHGAPSIPELILRMLILGPGIGAVVAFAAIKALGFMRYRVGVRRDYESLYSLGVAMAAFAAAESLHSSGFLAAFAAGLTIAVLDVELCDCFREYGETTAEMLLLFTFVLLGSSLIWTGFDGLSWPLIAFAAVALAVRPVTMFVTLAFSKIPRRERALIAWFGPRGLSTFLLVLVPIFEGVPGSEPLFKTCAFVVVLSVLIHGGSIMAFTKATPRPVPAARTEDSPVEDVAVGEIPETLTVNELDELHEQGQEIWLTDVRSTDAYLASDLQIKGALRLDPEQARRSADLAVIPKDAWVALFCT